MKTGIEDDAMMKFLYQTCTKLWGLNQGVTWTVTLEYRYIS